MIYTEQGPLNWKFINDAVRPYAFLYVPLDPGSNTIANPLRGDIMKRFFISTLIFFSLLGSPAFATHAIEDQKQINEVIRAILSNPTALNWLMYEINDGYRWYGEHVIAGANYYVEMHMLLEKNGVKKRLNIGFDMKSQLVAFINVSQQGKSLVNERLNTGIFSDYSKKYYCIQVKSYPPSEYNDGLNLFKKLRDKGYLVYYYTQNIENKNWMRIRVGNFSSKQDAKEFGDKFAASEKLTYFVTQAENIFVDGIAANQTVISTPSSRYMQMNGQLTEIYSIYDKIIEDGHLFGFYPPLVSVNNEIVLFFDAKVIKYNAIKNQTNILSEGHRFYNSSPKMSSSGKYIAYLDNYGWGMPTSLRLINLKKNTDTTLVDPRGPKNTQIKKFEWISGKDIILFIRGSAYKSSGGELFYTDPDGNQNLVIRTEPKDSLEVVDFFLRDNNVRVFFAHKKMQGDKLVVTKFNKNVSFDSLKHQKTISLEGLQ